MRKFLLLTLVFLPLSLSAQTLIPFSNGGKFGFRDSSGKIVINPKYDFAEPFSEGRALVWINDKYGFIDETGQTVVAAKFDRAWSFSSGRAIVKIGSLYGIIDRDGKEIVSPAFGEAKPFSDGMSLVKVGDKYGFVDISGNMAIPPIYDGASSFGEGIAMVKTGEDIGYIDIKGRTFSTEEEGIGFLAEEAAEVQSKLEEQSTAKMLGDASDSVFQNKKDTVAPLEKDSDNMVAAVEIPDKAPVEVDVDGDVPVGAIKSPDTIAVIISNENYEGDVVSVPGAINDGEILQKYLVNTLGIPTNQIEFFADATVGKMKRAMRRLQDLAAVFKDTGRKFNVIFYYSGHGAPSDDQKNAYLLPIDLDPTTIDLGMSLGSLYKELGQLGAANTLVLLDACFSGSARDNSMLASTRSVVIAPEPSTPKANTIVLAASSGSETAHLYSGKNHGLFTFFLLKKLNETKGNVTIGELGEYIRENVIRTSTIDIRKRQTPEVIPSPTYSGDWQSSRLTR